MENLFDFLENKEEKKDQNTTIKIKYIVDLFTKKYI